jgi:DNA modification methylase
MAYEVLVGSVLDKIREIESESVDSVITSPPYYGLRDYGKDSQIGLEETPELYIQKMVEVFREVHRVLKPTGTVWLNIGDTYKNSQLMLIPHKLLIALQEKNPMHKIARTYFLYDEKQKILFQSRRKPCPLNRFIQRKKGEKKTKN